MVTLRQHSALRKKTCGRQSKFHTAIDPTQFKLRACHAAGTSTSPFGCQLDAPFVGVPPAPASTCHHLRGAAATAAGGSVWQRFRSGSGRQTSTLPLLALRKPAMDGSRSGVAMQAGSAIHGGSEAANSSNQPAMDAEVVAMGGSSHVHNEAAAAGVQRAIHSSCRDECGCSCPAVTGKRQPL